MELFFSITVLAVFILVCAILLKVFQLLSMAPFERYPNLDDIYATPSNYLKILVNTLVIWSIQLPIFWFLVISTSNLIFWISPQFGDIYTQASVLARLSFAVCVAFIIFIISLSIKTPQSNIG